MLAHHFTLIAVGLLAGVCFAQPVPLPPAPPGVQVTHEEGYEFVTITHPGNQGFLVDDTVLPSQDIYAGNRVRRGTRVGQVNLPYRISRTETTGGQFGDFLNAFCAQHTITEWGQTPHFHFFGEVFRNGTSPVIENGRILRRVRNRIEHAPDNQITIHQAMFYCNWLHKNKPTDLAELWTGVYEVARYIGVSSVPSAPLTTPIIRNPQARFWIPTHSEWVKAGHYDPDRFGPGRAGYWLYPITRDTPPIGAPPAPYGDGESNWGFGWYFDENENYVFRDTIPVVSYPSIQSPWGLFDATGGMSENTTTALLWREPGDETFYSWNGYSFVVKSDTSDFYFDHVAYFGRGHWPSPFGSGGGGLRLAARAPCQILSDFNGDGVSDHSDHMTFLEAFFLSLPTSDVNQDETTDIYDYLDFVQEFLRPC